MEDEEHVIFGCPEYNICRLKYPELFNDSENNIKDLLNIDEWMNEGIHLDLDTWINNNINKRPLTPKSMPSAGDEHAKLKT